ncbi:acyl-CoA dehydrogenase [bacterium BMS3Bbin06]|nr:acyl-CoA dehydrogenase [bacterium BMS3Abin08]GBE34066.1 acyl-CoA dehydrogenase [bacterium BMS3Bbin06]
MYWNLSEDHKIIKETVSRIAQKELASRASEIDKTHSFVLEGLKKLREADILGLAIPSKYGGMGMDTLSFVLAVEEIAKACGSTALSVVSHSICSNIILCAGNEEQKEKHLPDMARGERLGAFCVHESNCGSNALALETRAVLEGDAYIVNGSKIFITNAQEAEIYAVLVRTDPSGGPQGISMLLIGKGTEGFSFGKKEEKMGLNGISSRELFFQDCRVSKENILGKEGEGLKIVGQAIIGFGFFGATAVSLGLAQVALDASIKHAKERIIAGNPIGANQLIQSLITEMSLGVDTARALLYSVVSRLDTNPPAPIVDALKVKLYASEVAIDVTNKALQVYGGHGYCRDFPLERYYRDARGLALHFKTTELLKADIGKILTGL